jgi:hypothetical protein
MTKTIGWIAGGLGAAGAVIATFLLPWVHYGQIDFGLLRFPGWGYYVITAAVLNVLTGWALMGAASIVRYAGIVMGLVTAAAAYITTMRYDETGAFFDDVVPLVMPSIGSGGPVAIAAAFLSAAALMAPRPK